MCGLFGIRAPERDVARVSYFGLFALQHRGQESAGIAVSDQGRLTVLRDMGLVAQVFSEQTLRGLQGDVALGHNGNLTNAEELRAGLAEDGVRLASTSDSELIAALIANDPAPLEDAVG